MSSYQLKSNLKLIAQNGLPNLPFVAIQLYWQETKMVSSITCLSFYHVSIILMKNFILVLEKSTEMVSTVIRKTGKTQVKRKFPPLLTLPSLTGVLTLPTIIAKMAKKFPVIVELHLLHARTNGDTHNTPPAARRIERWTILFLTFFA